jgi:hypothetical protein
MCKYCKNVKTGDDFEPLINLNLNFGMIGKTQMYIYLAPESKLTADLLFPDQSNDKAKSIKIKYCPMCGERL